MFNLSDLSQKNLADSAINLEIKEETERIVRQFDSKNALALSRYLKSKVSESAEIDLIYKEIIPQLEFIAIGLLKTSEVLNLIKEHFGVTLNFPFDIITPLDLVRIKLLENSFIDDELLREGISQALKDNENIVTKNLLEIGDRPGGMKPTIKNWLLDYDSRLMDKSDRSIARTEYFINSPNISKLSTEEKEKIKQLITVYDFVNTSSLIPSAYAGDYLVHWPNDCGFIISQGETIASLPPIQDTNLGVLSEEEEAKTSFEEKYLEEESDDE